MDGFVCLLGQALCPCSIGKLKKPFRTCVLVQKCNGEHLPLIQHGQIRREIIKPEGNIVASLTFCTNTGPSDSCKLIPT